MYAPTKPGMLEMMNQFVGYLHREGQIVHELVLEKIPTICDDQKSQLPAEFHSVYGKVKIKYVSPNCL